MNFCGGLRLELDFIYSIHQKKLAFFVCDEHKCGRAANDLSAVEITRRESKKRKLMVQL